jgi:hypothetical protein
MNNNFYDGFYSDFFENKNRKVKNKKNLVENRNQYREKVLEYLQLEFCELGSWWEEPTSNSIADINQNRVVVISIINDCFLDGIKINNAAGTVYEWLKGRNLI